MPSCATRRIRSGARFGRSDEARFCLEGSRRCARPSSGPLDTARGADARHLRSSDDGYFRTAGVSEPAYGLTRTTRPLSYFSALRHDEMAPYERVLEVPTRTGGVVRDLVTQVVDGRELALAPQPVEKTDANLLAIKRPVKVEQV